MRNTLKSMMPLIVRLRKMAAELPMDGEHRGEVACIVNGLIVAEDHALNVLEDTQIFPPEGFYGAGQHQIEPLNTEEEAIYNNLQTIIRFDDKLWATVTDAQKFATARLLAREGVQTLRHPVGGSGESYLGFSFPHIFIGVEADGYTHS